MKLFLLVFLAAGLILACEAAPKDSKDPVTSTRLPTTPAQQPNSNGGGQPSKSKSSEQDKSKKKSSSSSSESVEIELTCDDCGLSVNLAQNETFFALLTSLEANFFENSTEYKQLEALRRLYNLYAYNYTSIEVEDSEERQHPNKSGSWHDSRSKESNKVVIPYVELEEQVRCSIEVTELLPTILKNQYCPYYGPVPRLSSSSSESDESSESHGKSSEAHKKSIGKSRKS
uniref:Uncharacterized protein n=1 Tax=Acrobeloides nanus TaxID=290746 RepID=A0A914CS21_9BILA